MRLLHIKTTIILLLIFLASATASHSAEPLVWDFESGADGWKSVSKTMKMSVSEEKTASAESKNSLRFQGTVRDDADFAVSDTKPMNAYQQYRLTAKINLHEITANSKRTRTFSNKAYPVLICEFLTDDDTGSLGSVVTENIYGKYMYYLDEWMTFAAEFRAPWGTTQCRLKFASKWSPKSQEMKEFIYDFYLDDVKIEPIDAFSDAEKYRLKKFPMTDELRKTLSIKDQRYLTRDNITGRPRLYLTQDKIDDLRKKIETTHASLWAEVKEQADGLAKRSAPEYRGNAEGVYDEQWWMSGNGRSMITLAMAWHMTGDKKYFDAARDWALATCAYASWGLDWKNGMDCMTGHNLFGIAVTYDWLYNDLDDASRNTMRETLSNRAQTMFNAASKGIIVPTIEEYRIRPWPEWEEAWLQNHLWVNCTGLMAAGLALYHDDNSAPLWTGFALEKFKGTMAYLGPDGASHEGINYWSYGVEHLLKSMHLSRELLGADMYINDWFRYASDYRLYTGIPKNAWVKNSTTVNYGDSHSRDNSGPDHLLRALAAEYGNGYAQQLARELDDSGVLNAGNRWLNLIWYDPDVAEKSYDSLPTLKHFTDMDFVSARSGWSGDESYIFYKCGPYIGHKAIDIMNYCASSAHHTHPDQNSFMLFGGGEWLMRDDGNFGKYTGQHNTLIIDGGEQLGGGDSIFDGIDLHARKLKPHVITAESSPEFDHISGDAAEAYPREVGLKRFTRHLLYLKPNVLIVCDDIALDSARDLELRFHPGHQEATRKEAAFLVNGEKATLRIEPLTEDGVDISAYKHDLIDRRYNKSEMLAIGLKTKRSEWKNAIALSWTEAGVEPVAVTMRKIGNIWEFTADGRTVTLDWRTGEAVNK